MSNKKKYLHVTIDRKRWRRGGERTASKADVALLDENGQMCCLGFVAKACGVKLERGEQSDLSSIYGLQASLLPKGFGSFDEYARRFRPNSIHRQLIEINDNEEPVMRGKPRENQIKNLMLQAGVKVTFK